MECLCESKMLAWVLGNFQLNNKNMMSHDDVILFWGEVFNICSWYTLHLTTYIVLITIARSAY